MSFGPSFPPKDPLYTKVLDAGSAFVSLKTQVLATFTLQQGDYLINVKGAISAGAGLTNDNIHLIVSQSLTPSPLKFEEFAFQAFPTYNNNSTIVAVSVNDTLKIVGNDVVYLYAYDSQPTGSPAYTLDWSDLYVTTIRKRR